MSQQSLNVIPVFRQCLYYYPGRQPATSYGSNTQELRLQRCMPTSLMDKIFIIRADDVTVISPELYNKMVMPVNEAKMLHLFLLSMVCSSAHVRKWLYDLPAI